MSELVFASPPAPPPPPNRGTPRPFYRTRHTLQTASGRLWDISRPSSGVFLTQAGVEGMGRPEWSLHSTSSPVTHGARYHGRVAPAREVHLPLYMYHDGSSQDWTRLYRDFMRDMDPEYPVLWTVAHPDTGESKSLLMRFVGDGGVAETYDSRWRGWRRLPLDFVADESPFWMGRDIVRRWQVDPPVEFFDEDGSPPVHISRGATVASARVSNPGDEDAWPIWTLTGPFNSASVGVGGRVVGLPFETGAGDVVRVDTRPGRKWARGPGGERLRPSPRNFAPVPRGESVPLSIAMDGAGEVQLTLTPLYHDAY